MYKTSFLPNTRIDVADALRGIAVAGIILYHSVEHFNIFTQETIIHTLPSDQAVSDVLAWLFSGKMYGILGALLGACVCSSFLASSMWRSTMATS